MLLNAPTACQTGGKINKKQTVVWMLLLKVISYKSKTLLVNIQGVNVLKRTCTL